MRTTSELGNRLVEFQPRKNFNKEKIEIASSLCKTDLISDLVGEYPELQGVMGKYFALAQGFEADVANAISDHYLPIGNNSIVPKKPISTVSYTHLTLPTKA